MPQTNQTKSQTTSHRGAIYEQLKNSEKSSQSITINKIAPDEVYRFWRNFQNLPSFMKDLTSVTEISPSMTHWVVKLEQGPTVEWDAEIIGEVPNQMIAWQSVGDSDVTQVGAVWFLQAPANRGTIVRLSMNYSVPGGKISEFVAKLNGEDPESLILINLRRLKALLETGEVPTIEGQPSGREENSHPVQTH